MSSNSDEMLSPRQAGAWLTSHLRNSLPRRCRAINTVMIYLGPLPRQLIAGVEPRRHDEDASFISGWNKTTTMSQGSMPTVLEAGYDENAKLMPVSVQQMYDCCRAA